MPSMSARASANVETEPPVESYGQVIEYIQGKMFYYPNTEVNELTLVIQRSLVSCIVHTCTQRANPVSLPLSTAVSR